MSFLGICDQIRLVKISKYHNNKTKKIKNGYTRFLDPKTMACTF